MAEDQSALNDDQWARIDSLCLLEPDLENFVVDRLVERCALVLEQGESFLKESDWC